MWKLLNESVDGTSHRQSGVPCQDAHFVTPLRCEDGEQILFLACADGAGSAKESRAGAELACRLTAEHAVNFVSSGGAVSTLTPEILISWARAAHSGIVADAACRDLDAREMACTLLFGIVGQSAAAFLQVGDGGIVVRENEALRVVFWPQSGEYQNETHFITEPDFEKNVQCEIIANGPSDLALFTDGLQRLVLNYAARVPHTPFFDGKFKTLRENEVDDLLVPFRQFLDSQAVNERTDDDKTLILATRM
jgi:hypothetical protein